MASFEERVDKGLSHLLSNDDSILPDNEFVDRDDFSSSIRPRASYRGLFWRAGDDVRVILESTTAVDRC